MREDRRPFVVARRAGIRRRRAGTDLDADFFNPARALTARDAAARFADSERARVLLERRHFIDSQGALGVARAPESAFAHAPTVIRSSVERRRRSCDDVAHVRAAAMHRLFVGTAATCMRPQISRSTPIFAPSSMTDRGIARFGLRRPARSRGIVVGFKSDAAESGPAMAGAIESRL